MCRVFLPQKIILQGAGNGFQKSSRSFKVQTVGPRRLDFRFGVCPDIVYLLNLGPNRCLQKNREREAPYFCLSNVSCMRPSLWSKGLKSSIVSYAGQPVLKAHALRQVAPILMVIPIAGVLVPRYSHAELAAVNGHVCNHHLLVACNVRHAFQNCSIVGKLAYFLGSRFC